MKLNTKFMLVTGVTTFLILTCVLLAALSYLTGTLNKIQQDASEYAVKDMQFRAKSNLRRFGDILSATHARASTFFTSKNLPKEEMLSILTTRFEHSSGTDAVVIGKYNLDKKADFLTGQFGMISLHDGKKKNTTDFPGLYAIMRKHIDGKQKKTAFVVTADGECWILNATKGTGSKGMFFAVRICPETLNGTSLDLKSGLIIMRDDKVLYQNFEVFGNKMPDHVRNALPALAMQLKRCQPDAVAWKTFDDEQGRHNWLAGATVITPAWRSGESCLRLIRLYEYQEIMSDVTKMLHSQIPTLLFYTCMILLLGIVLLLLPLFYFCQQLTIPIVNAGLFANKLASGDFSAQSTSEDTGILEIDQLTKSLNHMRDHINAMIGKIRRNHGREADARQDAENINLLKSDFLDAMSLDYLEPLNSLYSFADLLEHRAKEREQISSDKLLTILKAVHLSMDELSEMTGIMADLTELDAPFRNAEQVRENVPTHELLQLVNEQFGQKAKERSISLEFRYNAQIPVNISVDKAKFLRIYGTLLKTLCFSANRSAGISLAWTTKEDYLVLTCTGKNEQNPAPLEYILYNSTHRPLRQFTSSSAIIHFTIIRKQLEALNGVFDVRCPDDENYEIELQFDISGKTDVHSVPDTILNVRPKRNTTPAKTKIPQDELFRIMSDICRQCPEPLPVLLCEDDESDRILLTAMLRGLNCNVTTADDIKSAQKILDEQAFKILILDLQIRNLDYNTFLQQIRTSEKHRELFLVALDTIQNNTERPLQLAGIDKTLLKPIHLDELTETVSLFLQKQH